MAWVPAPQLVGSDSKLLDVGRKGVERDPKSPSSDGFQSSGQVRNRAFGRLTLRLVEKKIELAGC